MPTRYYIQVALPVPLRAFYEYKIENDLPRPMIGGRVSVPFGTRQALTGVIVDISLDAQYPSAKHKSVLELIDTIPCVPEDLLKLCIWAAEYYMHPQGEAIFAAIPPYLRQNKSIPPEEVWVHTTKGLGLGEDALKRAKKQQEIHRFLLAHGKCSAADIDNHALPKSALKALSDKGLIHRIPEVFPPAQNVQQLLKQSAPELTIEQRAAIRDVHFHHFNCYLLHGITGSGKTEVYMHLVNRALEAGRQALVLIPEIGLSPQTVQRFKARFAVNIVEMHSGVSDAQRARNWLAARDGDAHIVIGTRLAAFTPMKTLGIIIVDEEHDNAYKQQETLRYSARDVSIYRAKKGNIPIMLGSATPSLESFNHARQGHYHHPILKQRAGPGKPPELVRVDLRSQKLQGGLCEYSLNAIQATIDQGGQALVFLNRRGYAPAQLCHNCGWISSCPACSASMTLHQHPPHLQCHHCGKSKNSASQCPNCGNAQLATQGVGTEQIEETLAAIFPGKKTLRIDRDSTRSKSALQSALASAHSGEASILIGTQMLAKGHHFTNLQLVVIVDADQGFLNADFRAMEKMGQLLAQVAGRCGRESEEGKVLIQSHRPDHPLLNLLTTRGYASLAKQLLQERQHAMLPPFWHCALFRAESKRAQNASDLLSFIVNIYQRKFPPNRDISLLGPMPGAMEKVQDRYRFQLLIKAKQRRQLKEILTKLLEEIDQHALSKRVRWSLDVDPIEA